MHSSNQPDPDVPGKSQVSTAFLKAWRVKGHSYVGRSQRAGVAIEEAFWLQKMTFRSGEPEKAHPIWYHWEKAILQMGWQYAMWAIGDSHHNKWDPETCRKLVQFAGSDVLSRH